MTTSARSTVPWLRTVAQQLAELRSEVVFLGGATLELFITDPAAGAPRPTRDVDVIIELGSYAEYVRLQERLRELGFREDTTPGAPLCRWGIQGIKVDVMPTREEILGFTNRWYAEAMREADEADLGSGVTIRLVSAPHFVATKLEAFRARGAEDYQTSHDLEDVVAVVDGRAELTDEVRASDSALREYLSEAIAELLDDEAFLDALPGFLPGDAASQARLPLVLQRLRALAACRGE